MTRFKPTHAAIVTILFLSLAACTVAPVPINFGSDGCHFCKMTIVDKQHAAELVTSKGKAYKYDAIECMIDDPPGFLFIRSAAEHHGAEANWTDFQARVPKSAFFGDIDFHKKFSIVLYLLIDPSPTVFSWNQSSKNLKKAKRFQIC